MRKKIYFGALSLIVVLPLMMVPAAPGLAQADGPYPTPNLGIPVVMESAFGLVLGAALIVVVIFAGVAFRRRKS